MERTKQEVRHDLAVKLAWVCFCEVKHELNTMALSADNAAKIAEEVKELVMRRLLEYMV